MNKNWLKTDFSGGAIPVVSFGIAGFIFLLAGLALKLNPIYCLAVLAVLAIGLFFKQSILSFLALLPFSYLLWKMEAVPMENTFLFALGFIPSFVFLIQLSASRGKEINPIPSLAAGAAVALFFVLFSAMKYEAFSSLFVVSPFGILLIISIIIFFRIQYLVWKGR